MPETSLVRKQSNLWFVFGRGLWLGVTRLNQAVPVHNFLQQLWGSRRWKISIRIRFKCKSLWLSLQSHPQLALRDVITCIQLCAYVILLTRVALVHQPFFKNGNCKTGCFSTVSKVRRRRLSRKYVHSCIAWQSFDQWLLSSTWAVLKTTTCKHEDPSIWFYVENRDVLRNSWVRSALHDRRDKYLVQSSPGVGMVGCKSATFYGCGAIDKLANLPCGRTSGS